MRNVIVLAIAVGMLAVSFPAEAAVVTVSMGGFAFTPQTRSAASGDTVNWTNPDSGTFHTATSYASPPHFNTPSVTGGGYTNVAFPSGGTYPYRCLFHPISMTGTVQVGPNTAPAMTTTLVSGTTVSGTVTLTGTALDSEGPNTWIEISVGPTRITSRVADGGTRGQHLGVQTDGSYGWSVSWNTLAFPNGNAFLAMYSTDGLLTSPIVYRNVTIANAAAVDIVVHDIVATGLQPKAMSARLLNKGTVASGPVHVELAYYYKGVRTVIGVVSAANVPPNNPATAMQTSTVNWNVAGKIGAWPVEAVADYGGLIAETDETNNVKVQNIPLVIGGTPIDATNP